MRISEILFVSVGLSQDIFEYALYKGALISNLKGSFLLKMMAVVCAWQIAAMFFGIMITDIPWIVHRYSEADSGWKVISACIFLGIGFYLFWKAKKIEGVLERRQDEWQINPIMTWACVTSVDALLAGIGIGFLETRKYLVLLIFGMIALFEFGIGILAGYRLGCGQKARNRAVIAGGCILFLTGIDVLVWHIR